jgi:CRP-like cAMP-binding protein
VIREGDRPHECCLLVEGIMCRHKSTPEGRRQIFSFHIAGDIPDLQSLQLKTMDHTLSTVSASRLAFIPHEDLLRLLHQHPRLSDVFWRDTLIDAAVFREWMLGIGRRPALNRCAHLLCELIVRMRAMGLTEDHAVELPLTQAELADALGLSIVHVNRTLQDLRRRGLIELGGGKLIVTDWEELKRTGEFEPLYLHLAATAGAAP